MSDEPLEPQPSLDETQSMGPVAQPAGAREHQLRPGDLLADRFTIVQFLASGGMGEVYEAADSYFQNKHFALKTVRPSIASDPAVRLRFEREVLLAREIRHDNVCPSYDLFRVEGPRGPIMFLTMKLLRGESLAARLARGGAFTPDAALPIVRQMAAALDAAHRAGVIHRDFKPGNVMLESSGQEARVSITDFGLSRSYQDDATLAQTGHISGTLGYIAPELLQGRPATPAGDVYSFGVVLYEILTSQRPVSKPGRHDFAPPSSLTVGLTRTWDRVVLGCLEYDPSRRFQSAGEALASLEGRNSSTRSTRVRVPLSRRRIAAAVALALLVVGLAAWLLRPSIYASLHPLPEKRYVALLAWPVDPNTDNRTVLRTVLDTIAVRLGPAEADKSRQLMLITPADVTAQAAPPSPKDTVSTLGANLVLAAALHTASSGLVLELSVLLADKATVLRHAEVSCPTSRPGELPELAAAAAAHLLDITLSRKIRTDPDELASVPPPAFQAFSAAEALREQPNDGGLDQAIEKYQSALNLDPAFALGYARIAMAYARKFDLSGDAAALSLASNNADLALHYNPHSAQAVLSRALVELFSGKTQSGLDGINQALQLDPGNPRILVYKALAFRNLGRCVEEEAVYREMIKSRPNYWPAYNELGEMRHRYGADEKAAEAFSEASEATPLAATPLTNLGAIDMLLNRDQEAEEAFTKSLQRAQTNLALLQLGTLDFKRKDYRKALDFYGKARDLRPRSDITWRNIGDCYSMLGDSAKVAESYGRAADLLADSIKRNPTRGSAWMTLAFYQAKLGRREEAEKALEEAEKRGSEDVQSQFKKAQVMELLGRNEEALRLVLDCMDKGLARVEVDLALDLAAVRATPQFRNYQQPVTPKPSGCKLDSK